MEYSLLHATLLCALIVTGELVSWSTAVLESDLEPAEELRPGACEVQIIPIVVVGTQRHVVQVLGHLAHVSHMLRSLLHGGGLGLGCGASLAFHIDCERLIVLVVESFDVGCALHSHHVVKSGLLTGELCLIVVTFGKLSCLLHFLLALSDFFGFPLSHPLSWSEGLRLRNG